jgi:hypothetical protein
MASISNVLPFPLGTTVDATTGGFLAANVGQLFKANGKIYRLAKAGASDLLVNAACVSAVSSGVKTYVITSPLTGAHNFACGVVPEEYTSNITTLHYFLMQVGGSALVLAGDTTTVATTGTEVRLVTGSAGTGYARGLAVFTTASTTEEYGVFALAANTAVATAKGQPIRCLLKIAFDG